MPILKKIIILFLIVSFFISNRYSANEYTYPERLKKPAIEVARENPEENWKIFTEAVIQKESSGREDVKGDDGKAVGVLQIWPIMVDEANRLLKKKKFTYDDRYDRDKSIEIFNTVQRHKNPDLDFKIACRIWNPTASDSYYNKIMEIYHELKRNA